MTDSGLVTRTELIGYCAVDSGQILITDPGYLNYWQDNKLGEEDSDGEYSYAGACQRTLADGFNGQLNFPIGQPGIGVVARAGFGDGYYPVYATIGDFDGWGKRVIKLEIVFIDDGESV